MSKFEGDPVENHVVVGLDPKLHARVAQLEKEIEDLHGKDAFLGKQIVSISESMTTLAKIIRELVDGLRHQIV